MAVLNSSGKMDSEIERLMRVVMGRRKASRHDLRRDVGIRSREQVASEEDSMADRTSSIVEGENVERQGRREGEREVRSEGEVLRERRESREAHSFLG